MKQRTSRRCLLPTSPGLVASFPAQHTKISTTQNKTKGARTRAFRIFRSTFSAFFCFSSIVFSNCSIWFNTVSVTFLCRYLRLRLHLAYASRIAQQPLDWCWDWVRDLHAAYPDQSGVLLAIGHPRHPRKEGSGLLALRLRALYRTKYA